MPTTADRLYEMLSINKMRQVDLINACKPVCDKYGLSYISKARMSEWMHGKCVPSQKYITVISETFNVSEPWLLGMNDSTDRRVSTARDEEEYILLDKWNRLNYDNKMTVTKVLDSLLATQEDNI